MTDWYPVAPKKMSSFFLHLYAQKEPPHWLSHTPPSAFFTLVSWVTVSGRRKRANHVRAKHLLPPCLSSSTLFQSFPVSQHVSQCFPPPSELSIALLSGQAQNSAQGQEIHDKRREEEVGASLQAISLTFPFFFCSSLCGGSPSWPPLLFHSLGVSRLGSAWTVWLHRCKMGCGNSSATSSSGGGE